MPEPCSRGRMPRPAIAAILWLTLAVWAGAILWLSSLTPAELPPAAFIAWDKLNHFIAFAAGGWLAASALQASRLLSRPWAAVILAIAIVAGFGAVDEMIQLFTPGRTGGDFYDWIADFLGATAGALSSRFTHGQIDRLVTRP